MPIKSIAAAIVAALLTLSAPANAQDTSELSFDQARDLGRQAVSEGNNALAIELAVALLEADPQDADAWLIQAAALLQRGDFVRARASAALAFRFGQTNPLRYEAAQIAALAASNEERLSISQWWLRRALTVAPTPEHHEQTLRDAAAVQQRNPWEYNFNLSLAPSDNVNNGAQSSAFLVNGNPVLGIFGLQRSIADKDLALPGWIAVLGVDARYRLQENPAARTYLTFGIYTRQVRLSDAAAEIAASAENHHYGYTRLSFGFEHDRAAENGILSYQAQAARVWRGGDPESTALSLSVSRGYSLRQDVFLRGTLQAGQIWRDDDFEDESQNLSFSGLAVLRMQNGSILSFNLSLAKNFTNGPEHNSQVYTVSASYAPAQQIGPAELRGTLGVSYTSFPDYSFRNGFSGAADEFYIVPGGRQDVRVFANLRAALPDMSYAGFVPVITLDASDTQSDLSQYEGRNYSLGVAFESSF